MHIVSKINRLVALAVLHANEFLISKETGEIKTERQLSKFFTVVIQPLSTRLIKPNFCLHANVLLSLSGVCMHIVSKINRHCGAWCPTCPCIYAVVM